MHMYEFYMLIADAVVLFSEEICVSHGGAIWVTC